MSTKNQIVALLLTFSAATPAWAALVWQSTFDTTADGVIDVKDRDSSVVMIGPVSSGRLQITTKDKASAQNSNDRAGRPLGATLNGNNSFSALYKFNWSGLSQANSPTTWEGFGFIGSDACGVTTSCNSPCVNGVCNITNQACGGLIQHRKDGTGNYLVTLGLLFAPSTSTSGGGGATFVKVGSEVNIGTDPAATTSDFYFALGYDGASSHVMSLGLYDASGVLLGSVSADLDASSGGLLATPPNTVQTMLNSLAVTHLGWNDYVGGSTNLTTVWKVDSLSYYNDARGAFDAVPNQSLGGCCLPTGTCSDNFTQSGCQAVGGGVWGGSGVACGSFTCPPPSGACCNPDGSCNDVASASCTGGSVWHGANSACTLTSCPQPPTGACCSNLDGSCSDGKTQFNCQGAWQGANTLCANITCPPPPPGSCCLPNGACISVSSAQCALQCGTFNGAGSSCATANCAQLATGACCLPNGSCTMTHEYDCAGAFHGPGSSCATANCQPMPSLVWWTNFATGNEGLVDVQNNNVTKTLIGPPCNGQAQIHTQCPPNSFTTNDRGGKPLGTTVNGNNSFSGLYRFTWSQLDQDTALMSEFPSFIGNKANCTEQVLGTLLTHNKVGDNYFVRMCSAGGENTNFFLFQCGPTWNLGPNAQTNSYQFVISYNGTTHLLTHAILDDQGNLLGTPPTQSFQTWDLDNVCPSTTFCPGSTTEGVGCQNYFDCTVPCPSCTKQTKYNALALTHLGWSDYTAFSGVTEDTIWQVDSLAYFNTGGGAYDAVFGPVPRGACCRLDGSCGDNVTELACRADGGGWSGVSTTCATTTCAGACCKPDGSCVDNQTVPACNALSGTFAGLNTTCATLPTPCPLPPCHNPFADADNDGDVDQDDFGKFQQCFTGSFQTLTSLGLLGYCHCFDRDGNDTVDGDDLVRFQACESGASVPADTNCDGAP